MPRRDAITLRGMRFHPRVGVLPHEETLPQPLEVDLTVWLTPPQDGGVPGIDYRELYAIAADVVAAEPLRYLELVAAEVAGRAMARERVTGVRVAVRKPHVALPGPLAFAEVVVERGRRG